MVYTKQVLQELLHSSLGMNFTLGGNMLHSHSLVSTSLQFHAAETLRRPEEGGVGGGRVPSPNQPPCMQMPFPV